MATFLSCLVFAALPCLSPSAQTAAGGRYEREGLSFSYPAGWALEDKSHEQAQHIILTREGGSSLVVVIAFRELIVSPGQLAASHRNIWRPYASDMALKLGVENKRPWEEQQCEQVGGRQAVGVKLNGKVGGEPTTGEVYALTMGRRFVNVFFVRHDRDEERDGPGWKALLASLKVEDPPNLPPLMAVDKEAESVGMLNGRAISKPQPSYPPRARSERAQGQVTVRVEVDENGDVTSAKAISGHSLLHDASERAAKKAKFSPTKLCGQPIKVRGVITYNFVMM
jgi:TonB family protein